MRKVNFSFTRSLMWMFWTDSSPGWLPCIGTNSGDQESFRHKYLPSSRDTESCFHCWGKRVRKGETGEQADRKQISLK